MSGPFGAVPGVSTSFVDGATVAHNLPPIAAEPAEIATVEPAPADAGKGRQMPANPEGDPSLPAARQRVLTPAARARAGEMLRNVGRQDTLSEVGDFVPVDPNDPMSELVERSLLGNTGAQLARRTDEPIEAEVEQFARDAERDAQGDAETPGDKQGLIAARGDQLTPTQRVQQWKAKADLLDALFDGGDMTEEMCRRFIVPFKENGRIVRESVYDAVRGRMRAGDYTRGKQQLAEIRRKYETAEAGLVQVVGALTSGDPAQFRAAIEFLPGAIETFFKACVVQGFQWDAERRLSPQERALLNHNRQLMAERQRQELETQALRMQQQRGPVQPTQNELMVQFDTELKKLLPIAADRLQRRGTPYVDSKFTRMLWKPTWDSFLETFNGNLTVDDVTDQLTSIMEQANAHQLAGGIVHEPIAAREVPPVSRTSPAPAAQLNTQNLAAQAGAPSYGRPPERARIGELAQRVNGR